jgi:hypothetical protein
MKRASSPKGKPVGQIGLIDVGQDDDAKIAALAKRFGRDLRLGNIRILDFSNITKDRILVTGIGITNKSRGR